MAEKQNTRRCAARCCNASIREDWIMCTFDWSLVTRNTKQRLQRSARGSQAYHEALNDAVEEVSRYKAEKATGWRGTYAV